ncbi:phage baseplate protein [Paenibacillus montanisoli]|uniref:T4 family baseplate hub assembly chaperone n=1 Tax=Paenibacillus montanisoli TaxID=2081970 RepID=UPI0010580605|nr:phage baseplate protein [Paenibacillus montanisoli]
MEHVFPACTRERLAILPIGRRDELLFAARTLTFGQRLPSLVACPACGERLEFDFEAGDLGISADVGWLELEQAEEERLFVEEKYTVDFGLLTSADLCACRTENRLEDVRKELARRCVRRAWLDGREIQAEELPEHVIVALSRHVEQGDPHALIEFDLNCPACEGSWQNQFDIVSFFWTEIESQARRLLREVHTLARSYGWTESDILALSTPRRQFYLEMVTE